MINNPTHIVSEALTAAYDHFNQALFNGRLPSCIIHMHRKAKCYGYFAGGRFGIANNNTVSGAPVQSPGGKGIDEIALNPTHFQARTVEQSLSTLVHEMVHLWQYHYGNQRKPGYHDKEWAEMMIDVGLMPSTTGAPGGKQTGQKVSHYIIENGDYAGTCMELLATGFKLPYVELWSTDKKTVAKKAASKTKYCCPACGANAWAKPDTALVCGGCRVAMTA